MGRREVLDWFRKQRECGVNDWYCMSTVVREMGAQENTSQAQSIRRSIVGLWGDGFLDQIRPNFWHRYFRLNDKYLKNFKELLK